MNMMDSIKQEVTRAALIGGHWVDGAAGHFEVKSPHSGAVLHKVGQCDASDVDKAVAAAKAAQPE
jgi:succinate-semialdehyde dehydrogenase / glutarate-semialdehyde dehydrogenase